MTNGVGRAAFVDTNVLVYANAAQAPLHRPALQTLRRLHGEGAELWISRQVLREYLATRSRSQSFAGPEATAELAERIRQFERLFRVADDDATVTSRLLELIEQVSVAGKQIHDANIVATMQANEITRLVTHNVADFGRFGHLVTLLPLDPIR